MNCPKEGAWQTPVALGSGSDGLAQADPVPALPWHFILLWDHEGESVLLRLGPQQDVRWGPASGDYEVNQETEAETQHKSLWWLKALLLLPGIEPRPYPFPRLAIGFLWLCKKPQDPIKSLFVLSASLNGSFIIGKEKERKKEKQHTTNVPSNWK